MMKKLERIWILQLEAYISAKKLTIVVVWNLHPFTFLVEETDASVQSWLLEMTCVVMLPKRIQILQRRYSSTRKIVQHFMPTFNLCGLSACSSICISEGLPSQYVFMLICCFNDMINVYTQCVNGEI